MGNANIKKRKLSVLVIASRIDKKGNQIVIGNTSATEKKASFVQYVELLSAFNYPFDVIETGDLSEKILYHNDTLNYSVVILTDYFSFFTDTQISLLKNYSGNYGLTIISEYDKAGISSYELFGIKNINRRKILYPLIVNIVHFPGHDDGKQEIANYGLKSAISGVRQKKFRKLPFKYIFRKCYKLLRGLTIPYVACELEDGHNTLAVTANHRKDPIAWSFRYGKAVNYYFSMDGGELLDKYNSMHYLVRACIEQNSGIGMCWADIDQAMVLRMDDPGSCMKSYKKLNSLLDESDWAELGNLSNANGAPVNIMYTSKWVDNGDEGQGELYWNDSKVSERTPGKEYDSPLVKYKVRNGTSFLQDFSSEYRGIKDLLGKGIVEIHSHGLTHLDRGLYPEKEKGNCIESSFHHEFYHVDGNMEVSQGEQQDVMRKSREKIEEYFCVKGNVLTPSGHKHDNECDILAFKNNFYIFSSDYTGLLIDSYIVRNWKIPSVFLYLKDIGENVAKTGYPVVGVFHDYEIKNRFHAFSDKLIELKKLGFRRYITFNDLIFSLCSVVSVVHDVEKSAVIIRIRLPLIANRNVDSGNIHEYKISIKMKFPDRCRPMMEKANITGGSIYNFKSGDGNSFEIYINDMSDRTIESVIPLAS